MKPGFSLAIGLEVAPVQVGGILGHQHRPGAVAASAALNLLQRADEVLRVRLPRSRDCGALCRPHTPVNRAAQAGKLMQDQTFA